MFVVVVVEDINVFVSIIQLLLYIVPFYSRVVNSNANAEEC